MPSEAGIADCRVSECDRKTVPRCGTRNRKCSTAVPTGPTAANPLQAIAVGEWDRWTDGHHTVTSYVDSAKRDENLASRMAPVNKQQRQTE